MMQRRFSAFEKADLFKAKGDAWIMKNRNVWEWMKDKAREASRARRRFSVAALVEEARYTKPVQGVDEYRINNDIRSYLARRLKREVPECADYIEIRESVVDAGAVL